MQIIESSVQWLNWKNNLSFSLDKKVVFIAKGNK